MPSSIDTSISAAPVVHVLTGDVGADDILSLFLDRNAAATGLLIDLTDAKRTLSVSDAADIVDRWCALFGPHPRLALVADPHADATFVLAVELRNFLNGAAVRTFDEAGAARAWLGGAVIPKRYRYSSNS